MKYKGIFENTYKGKKILLTGHTGFKGSWLLAWLHQLGAEIKGYALQPENENDLYNLINGDSLCHSVIADIRHKEKIKEEILSFQPDFILPSPAWGSIFQNHLRRRRIFLKYLEVLSLRAPPVWT